MDRVRPIYIPPELKKTQEKPVEEHMRGQLRSVIGSLAWLARVCRPDLAYAVCRLQSSVHQASIGDVRFANKIIELTKGTKDKGITFPLKKVNPEDCMIVAIQDASHAADYDVSKTGVKLGYIGAKVEDFFALLPRTFGSRSLGTLLLLSGTAQC